MCQLILSLIIEISYLLTIRYKTRFVHADHFIKDRDKEPNETSEIELLLSESCQQSLPVQDSNTVSDDICQPKVSAADVKSKPSFDQGTEGMSSPVVLRRLSRIRKPVDRLNL